jgi:hypothetical protein
MQAAAGFLTFWDGNDGESGSGVYVRRHLPTGDPVGHPMLIEQLTHCSDTWRCDQTLIGIGVDSGGDFAGLWDHYDNDNTDYFIQWFNRDAIPITGHIPLSDENLENASYGSLRVATGPDHTVTAAWFASGDERNDGLSVLHAQTYSASGEQVGTGFVQVIPGNPVDVRIAWNPLTRSFVVAWVATEQFPIHRDSSSYGFYVQRFLTDGRSLDPKPLQLDRLMWSDGSIDVACNVQGYCVIEWAGDIDENRYGALTRIMRPDGALTQRVIAIPYPQISFGYFFPTGAYGANGVLLMAGTDFSGPDLRGNVVARRLIASPGDEVCQRVGNEVRCDSGRTGSLPELRLASFGLDRRDKLLFGDADGDGRADPCRVRSGVWRCDTDHEGGTTEAMLNFAGAAAGTPLLGDLNGDGRADACSWSAGILRCDTAHNGGSPELTLTYGRKEETPFLGDLDGDGRDDLCLGSRGSLRCDIGHDGGRTEVRFAFGQAGDLFVLGDFDGNGTDDPCLVRAGKLLCDTAHDGGEPEGELVLGTPGASVLLGNLDGV